MKLRRRRKKGTIKLQTVDETKPPKKDENVDYYEKISAKKKRLVDEYLKDLHQYNAYIRAGFKSRESVGRLAARKMFSHPHIQAAISQRMRELTRRCEVTAERVLKEIAAIGYSNLQDFCSWDDRRIKLKKSEELTREQMSCISEVIEQVNNTGFRSIRIKTHSKMNALQMLAKYVGLEREGGVSNMTPAELVEELRRAEAEMLATLPVRRERTQDLWPENGNGQNE